MRNAGLEEAQAGIKIAGRNINTLRYADDTTLMADWRRTKGPLDETERGEWKSWLKTQHSENEDYGIRSHHFMKIVWKQWKKWQIFFFFFVSKITVDGDCSHEFKRLSLFEREAMTNLYSILKSRDITLPTKVLLVKAMFCFVLFFPISHVWMWELAYRGKWSNSVVSNSFWPHGL